MEGYLFEKRTKSRKSKNIRRRNLEGNKSGWKINFEMEKINQKGYKVVGHPNRANKGGYPPKTISPDVQGLVLNRAAGIVVNGIIEQRKDVDTVVTHKNLHHLREPQINSNNGTSRSRVSCIVKLVDTLTGFRSIKTR